MKPELALSDLEREPIVHFGCTWTELKRCLYRSAALAGPATLGAMVLLPSPAWVAPGLVGWLGLAYALTRHIHKHRAGKPLYYERHRKAVKALGAPFVKAGLIYQSQRTRQAGRAPTRPAH